MSMESRHRLAIVGTFVAAGAGIWLLLAYTRDPSRTTTEPASHSALPDETHSAKVAPHPTITSRPVEHTDRTERNADSSESTPASDETGGTQTSGVEDYPGYPFDPNAPLPNNKLKFSTGSSSPEKAVRYALSNLPITKELELEFDPAHYPEIAEACKLEIAAFRSTAKLFAEMYSSAAGLEDLSRLEGPFATEEEQQRALERYRINGQNTRFISLVTRDEGVRYFFVYDPILELPIYQVHREVLDTSERLSERLNALALQYGRSKRR